MDLPIIYGQAQGASGAGCCALDFLSVKRCFVGAAPCASHKALLERFDGLRKLQWLLTYYPLPLDDPSPWIARAATRPIRDLDIEVFLANALSWQLALRQNAGIDLNLKLLAAVR